MDIKGVVGVSATGLLGLESSLHTGCFFAGPCAACGVSLTSWGANFWEKLGHKPSGSPRGKAVFAGYLVPAECRSFAFTWFDTQTSCLQLSAIGRFVRTLVGHDGLASEFFTVETCLVNLVR